METSTDRLTDQLMQRLIDAVMGGDPLTLDDLVRRALWASPGTSATPVHGHIDIDGDPSNRRMVIVGNLDVIATDYYREGRHRYRARLTSPLLGIDRYADATVYPTGRVIIEGEHDPFDFGECPFPCPAGHDQPTPKGATS